MKISGHPGLADFAANHLAATVAVPIDANGTIHAASLLYWNSVKPFEFFFVTSRESEKCKLIRQQGAVPCAVVGAEKGTDYPKGYDREFLDA
jgi:uncharacterized protein YhbP (UPF0306 family)